MNENALYVTALLSCLLPSCVRDDDGPTGSEIPLEEIAVRIDDERFDSGDAAAAHTSIGLQPVLFIALCRGGLPVGEHINFEEIVLEDEISGKMRSFLGEEQTTNDGDSLLATSELAEPLEPGRVYRVTFEGTVAQPQVLDEDFSFEFTTKSPADLYKQVEEAKGGVKAFAERSKNPKTPLAGSQTSAQKATERAAECQKLAEQITESKKAKKSTGEPVEPQKTTEEIPSPDGKSREASGEAYRAVAKSYQAIAEAYQAVAEKAKGSKYADSQQLEGLKEAEKTAEQLEERARKASTAANGEAEDTDFEGIAAEVANKSTLLS